MAKGTLSSYVQAYLKKAGTYALRASVVRLHGYKEGDLPLPTEIVIEDAVGSDFVVGPNKPANRDPTLIRV